MTRLQIWTVVQRKSKKQEPSNASQTFISDVFRVQHHRHWLCRSWNNLIGLFWVGKANCLADIFMLTVLSFSEDHQLEDWDIFESSKNVLFIFNLLSHVNTLYVSKIITLFFGGNESEIEIIWILPFHIVTWSLLKSRMRTKQFQKKGGKFWEI